MLGPLAPSSIIAQGERLNIISYARTSFGQNGVVMNPGRQIVLASIGCVKEPIDRKVSFFRRFSARLGIKSGTTMMGECTNEFGNAPYRRGNRSESALIHTRVPACRFLGTGLIYERNCPTRSLKCFSLGPGKDN